MGGRESSGREGREERMRKGVERKERSRKKVGKKRKA